MIVAPSIRSIAAATLTAFIAYFLYSFSALVFVSVAPNLPFVFFYLFQVLALFVCVAAGYAGALVAPTNCMLNGSMSGILAVALVLSFLASHDPAHDSSLYCLMFLIAATFAVIGAWLATFLRQRSGGAGKS